MSDAVKRGRFITLEGGEGVGKSTQLTRLAETLRARGIDLITTREPGGSEGAEAIRDLLMTGGADRWTDRAEALLFAAARADHVARVIRPALAAGRWVLCDRFVDSSRAYQGAGGGLSDDAIMALHRVGSEGLMPDRTFLLTAPDAVVYQRLAARDGDNPDRMGSKSVEYQRRLVECFHALAKDDPDRWRVVDTSGPRDAVTAQMVDDLAPWLP